VKAFAITINVIAGGLIALIGGFVIVQGASLLVAMPFHPGIFVALALSVGAGIYLVVGGLRRVRAACVIPKEVMTDSRSIEDRLDELERLKRRDMVTPEEYAAKRQEILKDL
jgi:hypothetical protein